MYMFRSVWSVTVFSCFCPSEVETVTNCATRREKGAKPPLFYYVHFTIILPGGSDGPASYKHEPMRLFTTVKIVNYRIDCALTILKLFQGNIY